MLVPHLLQKEQQQGLFGVRSILDSGSSNADTSVIFFPKMTSQVFGIGILQGPSVLVRGRGDVAVGSRRCSIINSHRHPVPLALLVI